MFEGSQFICQQIRHKRPGCGHRRLRLELRVCSPGTSESGEGGGGPGDDVMVGGGVGMANAGEGAAGVDRGG